ncbi:putative GATA zinc finger domain-containing protein 13-like [Capsicum annuum]|nr:putative GATA zinc finger domain-containing protein 13-like [Capsicum annuum]
MSVAHEWLSSTSSKVEPITEESIVSILNFVETTLGPLSGSHEVEILERSRNVLGLVELIREELLGYLVKREEDNDEGKRRTHEMMKLIAEAFSEELGPVSASSQERVPMPEGMVLNQNLDDLDAKSGDLGLHIPTSFSLGRSISSEKVDSQKKEMVYDDYPPANDLKTGNNADDEADDLVKLTEQSLFPKKKENQANQAKPRPVVVSVVKRDDGNGPFIPAKKVESNDDLISGAVNECWDLDRQYDKFDQYGLGKYARVKDSGEILFHIVPKNELLPSFNATAPEGGPIFQGRRVPSKQVEWGKFNMVEAERRLLANALLDLSNERFVLLSESCIPLYNFTTIYNYIMNSANTFTESYDLLGPVGRGRYNKRMKPWVTLGQWRKGSQWFEVDREIAIDIISDQKYSNLFKRYCKPACYSDEHYLPTFVTMKYWWKNENRTLTWVDWAKGGPHPTKFIRPDVTEDLLNMMRNGTKCEYNGRPSKMCYMFARKFLPGTLDRLLRFAPKVMKFG